MKRPSGSPAAPGTECLLVAASVVSTLQVGPHLILSSPGGPQAGPAAGRGLCSCTGPCAQKGPALALFLPL